MLKENIDHLLFKSMEGDLSIEEQQTLDYLLLQNPEFEKDVNLWSDVYNHKEELNDYGIATGLIKTAPKSTVYIKYLGGLLLVVLLSSSWYFWSSDTLILTQDSKNEGSEILSIESAKKQVEIDHLNVVNKPFRKDVGKNNSTIIKEVDGTIASFAKPVDVLDHSSKSNAGLKNDATLHKKDEKKESNLPDLELSKQHVDEAINSNDLLEGISSKEVLGNSPSVIIDRVHVPIEEEVKVEIKNSSLREESNELELNNVSVLDSINDSQIIPGEIDDFDQSDTINELVTSPHDSTKVINRKAKKKDKLKPFNFKPDKDFVPVNDNF